MNSAKISFLGDISLNDDYIALCESNQNCFQDLDSILSQNDFVVGNLESLVVGNQGENFKKRPRLKTTIKSLISLKSLHLDVATLAHNHVYDHYEDGLIATKEYLNKNGIATLGAGQSLGDAKKTYTTTINGIRFCMLNYVDRNTNPNLPDDASIFVNYFELDNVIADVKEYKKSTDFLIVLLHWGGKCEYSSYPFFDQPKVARKIIDSGCDLIVGGHSHTLQPYEVYHNKYIFYSLGNFCFSDLYFDGKIIYQDGRKARETVIPQIEFNSNGTYTVCLFGVENKELYLYKSNKVLRRLAFRNLIFKYFQKIEILWRINNFLFKKFHRFESYFFNDGITNKKELFQQISRILKKYIVDK